MSNLNFSSSSLENPLVSTAYSSGLNDDVFEDACSICLEPFNTADPATVWSSHCFFSLLKLLSFFGFLDFACVFGIWVLFCFCFCFWLGLKGESWRSWVLFGF